MSGTTATVAADLREQAWGCRMLGSPFYAALLERMALDVESEGVVWQLLEPHAAEPGAAAYPLRVLGGVHRMVLAGDAADLAAHFQTTGGDGDAAGAWPAFRDLLAARPDPLLDALRRPPQTNEVGRTASLAGGLAVVAHGTGLPLRLFELGTSAALNLRLDHYWYEQGDRRWGARDSAVRFVDLWSPGCPPFSLDARIALRRGCDRDPIDATNDPGAPLTLLSYVWPGQHARFESLRHALAIAADVPVTVDRSDAVEWLPEQLDDGDDGLATVVMHSVFWQYLSDPQHAAITTTIETAGARATAAAPLAWLRLEPSASARHTELRLTTWPGGEETLLATAGFHAGRVRWRDDAGRSGAERGEQ